MRIEDCTHVELSGAAYYNMIRSLVEWLPKETGGNLFGRINSHTVKVLNAYPSQVAKRKPGSITFDEEAVERLRNLEETLGYNGSQARVIGGYHSHPKDEEIVPTQYDIAHIKEEVTTSRSYWLEIILQLRRERNKHCMAGEQMSRDGQ